MRILLADDQSEVRSALRLLLEHEPELEVVAEVEEAGALLAEARAVRPDVILLDWELPGVSTVLPGPRPRRVLVAALHEIDPGLAVVSLSGRPEARRMAMAAGSDTFVCKGDPPDHLLAALRLLAGSQSPRQ
jgi:two-component system response regulator DesR